MEDHRSWVRGFRMCQPEHAQARSPWPRDGALEPFTFIRGKAEAQAHYYE